MNSTRLISIAVLVSGTCGLGLLVLGESAIPVWAGALLVVSSTLLLSRHFWREGERRARREIDSAVRRLTQLIQDQTTIRSRSAERVTNQVAYVDKRVVSFTRGVLEYMSQIELDTKTVEQEIVANRRGIERSFEKTDRNAVRYRDDVLTQISGVIGVYATLNPSLPYPPFGGWAISGDCAQRLITLILMGRPTGVIEAGSGLSTLLAAQALEKNGGEGLVHSLDHEERWLEETASLLKEHGLSQRVRLHHAPLVPFDIDGDVFRWYDLSRVDLPDQAQLIFIDGPPKATGRLARYPALPLLYDRLSIGGVLLMDDARRQDEKEAIARWEHQYRGLSIRYHTDAKGTVEVFKVSDGH